MMNEGRFAQKQKEMENQEFILLCRLSSYHVHEIAEAVIKYLMELKEDVLLSGDDSGLKTLWEEICVQVQGEESFFWNSYEETIHNLTEKAFDEQPAAVKNLIMYIEGLEIDRNENDQEPVYSLEAAIQAIKNEVLTIAGDFENSNITRYLELDFEDDEEEEDDEDFDETDLEKDNE